MGFVTSQFHVERLAKRSGACKAGCGKPIPPQVLHIRTEENTAKNRRSHRFHAECFRQVALKELEDYKKFLEAAELDVIVGMNQKSKLFDAQRGVDKPL